MRDRCWRNSQIYSRFIAQYKRSMRTQIGHPLSPHITYKCTHNPTLHSAYSQSIIALAQTLQLPADVHKRGWDARSTRMDAPSLNGAKRQSTGLFSGAVTQFAQHRPPDLLRRVGCECCGSSCYRSEAGGNRILCLLSTRVVRRIGQIGVWQRVDVRHGPHIFLLRRTRRLLHFCLLLPNKKLPCTKRVCGW